MPKQEANEERYAGEEQEQEQEQEVEEMTEQEAEEEIELINSIFPDPPFCICIPSCELDDIVSTEKLIIIKNTFGCYCCQNKINNHYIEVKKNPNSEGITNRDMIHAMINYYNTVQKDFNWCNHCFLEFFTQISTIEFNAAFGS